MTTSIKVGQQLVFVQTTQYGRKCDKLHDVIVTSVGHKWFYVDGTDDRFDKETLHADGKGYASPGTCWLTREAYEEHRACHSLFTALQRALTYKPQPGVTAKDVAEAIKLLRLEIPKDETKETETR